MERVGKKNKRRRNFCLLGAKNENFSASETFQRAVNHILSYSIYMYCICGVVMLHMFLESIYVLSITTNRKVTPSGVSNNRHQQPKNGQSGIIGVAAAPSHLPPCISSRMSRQIFSSLFSMLWPFETRI